MSDIHARAVEQADEMRVMAVNDLAAAELADTDQDMARQDVQLAAYTLRVLEAFELMRAALEHHAPVHGCETCMTALRAAREVEQ